MFSDAEEVEDEPLPALQPPVPAWAQFTAPAGAPQDEAAAGTSQQAAGAGNGSAPPTESALQDAEEDEWDDFSGPSTEAAGPAYSGAPLAAASPDVNAGWAGLEATLPGSLPAAAASASSAAHAPATAAHAGGGEARMVPPAATPPRSSDTTAASPAARSLAAAAAVSGRGGAAGRGRGGPALGKPRQLVSLNLAAFTASPTGLRLPPPGGAPVTLNLLADLAVPDDQAAAAPSFDPFAVDTQQPSPSNNQTEDAEAASPTAGVSV